MIYLDKNSNVTIHEQIVSKISKLILSGALQKDEKLLSVRKLASELIVSTQTINKAYLELESLGYIYSIKNKGYFVKSINEKTKNTETEKAFKTLDNAVQDILKIGVPLSDILRHIEKTEE